MSGYREIRRKVKLSLKGQNKRGAPGSAWASLSQYTLQPTSILPETSLPPGPEEGVTAIEGPLTVHIGDQGMRTRCVEIESPDTEGDTRDCLGQPIP